MERRSPEEYHFDKKTELNRIPGRKKAQPSFVARMHDQKFKYGSHSIIHDLDPSSIEYRRTREWLAKYDAQESVGSTSEHVNAIKHEQGQQKLLKEKKHRFHQLLDQTLRDVKEYVRTIYILFEVNNQRKNTDQHRFLKEKEKSDDNRHIKHNALISSIHSTIRFARMNFGEISPNVLEKYEEELDERGEEPLEIKRIPFSKNVFLQDSINVEDRESITHWAIALYDGITELENTYQLK